MTEPAFATTATAADAGLRLAQSLLTCAPGETLSRATGGDEEVLFVLDGSGTLVLDERSHVLERECGAHLEPGERYELHNDGGPPLRLVSVRIPDPLAREATTGPRAVVRRLSDQVAQDATAEREFRIVADPSCGLRSATHFVGYIPPGRAPDHFHTYDEVIYVLDGEGTFHADDGSRPIGAGSTIELRARTVHCLENSGAAVMRIVGVFRPAGSPAAAYYPDGSPAQVEARAPAHD